MDQTTFEKIVKDNETAVATALAQGSYVESFLLLHSLVESLLRVFQQQYEDKVRFSDLIHAYRDYLVKNNYPEMTFVTELEEFNRRRNRIIHQLWRKGYTSTNNGAEEAAKAAIVMYGLFIEWLETFEPFITQVGFTYDTGAQRVKNSCGAEW